MAQLTIESFQYGLDTRRSVLTSQPGTLVTGQNGHINQGRQFEKRYAFCELMYVPTSTYGLTSTSAGLETYGSRPTTGTTTQRARTSNVATLTVGADHGFGIGDVITVTGLGGTGYNLSNVQISAVAATTISYPSTGSNEGTTADVGGTVTLVVPTGLTYVRLRHPAILRDAAIPASFTVATYDAAKHAMTGVVWSRTHDGKALVAATFADGRTFLYYDGSIVLHSYSGYVFAGWSTQVNTNASLAEDFADCVNNITQWSSVAAGTLYANKFSAFDSNLRGGIVNPPSGIDGTTFTFSKSSSSGDLAYLDETSFSGVASAGTTTFTVAGAAGNTYQISAPVEYNNTTRMIIGSAAWTTDNVTTAGLIVTSINAGTATHGFSASNGGTAVVTVTNPTMSQAYSDPNTAGNFLRTWNPLYVSSADTTAAGYHAFSVSSVAVTNGGRRWFGFTENWVEGDWWSAIMVTELGNIQLGKGNISGGVFNNGFVFKDRAYVANGRQFNLSAVGDLTGWETQDIGAGSVPFASQYGENDTVQAFEAYQGKLVVFGKRSAQIWQTDASLANFALQQTLSNLGTRAPFSVGAIGELEVLFLADSGIRSLRTRETSLNAIVSDIGTPIDSLILSDIRGLTDAEIARACAIVEPGANRYWVYVREEFAINSLIYVLSYFPESKVTAWSTYTPTYFSGFTVDVDDGITGTVSVTFADNFTASTPFDTDTEVTAAALATVINAGTGLHGYVALVDGPTLVVSPTTTAASRRPAKDSSTGDAVITVGNLFTSFEPKKFVIHNSQVYVRTSSQIFSYGGSTREEYDGTITIMELPWLSDRTPFNNKTAKQINVTMSGDWKIEASMSPRSSLVEVKPDDPASTGSEVLDSTHGRGTFSFSQEGTHFKLKATTQDTWGAAATISSMTMQYDLGQEI